MSRLRHLAICELDMPWLALENNVLSVDNSAIFENQAEPAVNIERQSPSSTLLALHHAARLGDLATAQQLIMTGYNVNEPDLFGSTPLHMAAMYGHKSMVECLLSYGANLNAKTYQLNQFAYTPLDLAAEYALNTEVFHYLLSKGAQPDHWDNLVAALIKITLESYENLDFNAFENALNKIEMAAKHTSNALWVYTENEVKPVYILYKSIAPSLGIAEYYQRFQQTIDYLLQVDKMHLAEQYIAAKNLLHAFPSDNEYFYKIGPNNVKLTASGYYYFMTVGLAEKTLNDYQQLLNTTFDVVGYQAFSLRYSQADAMFMQSVEAFTQEKRAVFEQVAHIFKQGAIAAEQAANYEVSVDIFTQYEAGNTILLPCGWDGHAIDIILNKELNLFMVANSGDRFAALKSGLNAYNMQFPLIVNDIYEILNNEEQMNLEFKKFYDMGLIENAEYSFFAPSQIYGNCAWYSQEIAQKALLLIEISKITSHPTLAYELADSWYHDYLDYHQTTVLETYLENPFLEVAALGDILLNYHHELNTHQEQVRAELILEVLTDSIHHSDFMKYYEAHVAVMSAELVQFISKYDEGFSAFHKLSEETVLCEQDIIQWEEPLHNVFTPDLLVTLAPSPHLSPLQLMEETLLTVL